MANAFRLKVNTPNGILFEDEILQIELKTKEGYLAILANHAPLIGSIEPSICYIRDLKNNRVSALINQGMFEVRDNVINVITDFFDFTTNVNVSVIEARQKKIEQALKKRDIKLLKDYENIEITLEQNMDNLKKLINK